MAAEAWIALGRQAACAGLLAAAALGWGRWVLGAAGLGRSERSTGWCMSLGLLALGFLFFLCSLAGVLTPFVVGGIALAGLGNLAFASATSRAAASGWHLSPWHLSSFSAALAIAGFGAVLFSLTLYPPHAFDETVYHLPIAASLAEHGEARWLDNLRVPVFPQTAEALAAGLWRFGGPEATHLLQALSFLALVLLLVGSGGPSASGGRVSWSGRLAAATVAGSPLFVYQATTFYVDLVVALALTAAVLAAERYRADPTAGRAWLGVAAFATGLAPTIKYLGVLGSVAVLVLVATAQRPVPRRRFGDLVFFLAVAGAVAAPTVLWLWKTAGNPVFPFLPSVFGPTGLNQLSRGTDTLERVGILLSLPWNAFADRALVGQQPPPSPWLWVAVAMVAIAAALSARRRDQLASAIRIPAVAAAITVCGFFLLFVAQGETEAMDLRYLLPAGPLFAVAFGRVLDVRLEPHHRWFRPLVAVALALPGLAYGVFQLWRLGDLPLTAVERETFLLRQHVGLGALRQAETLSDRLYVVGNERLVGLGRGVVYGDVMGRLPNHEVLALLASPDRLAERLDGFGIGALVILRSAPVPAGMAQAFDGSGRFRLVFEDDQATAWQLSGGRRPPLSPSQ